MESKKLKEVLNQMIFNVGRLTHHVVSTFKNGYNYITDKDVKSASDYNSTN